MIQCSKFFKAAGAFALMIVMIMPATAQTRKKVDRSARTAGKAVIEKTLAGYSKTLVPEAPGISARKVMSAEEAASGQISIVGDWYVTLGDYYYEIYSQGSYDVFYQSTIEDDGLVWFKDPTNYEYPFAAEYDEVTGTLTFIKVKLEDWYNDYGKFDYYLFQEPYTYEVQGKFNYGNFTAQFDSTTGVINFKPGCGIEWNNYKDLAGSDYFVDEWVADLEKAVKDIPRDEDPDEWQSIGNALLMDGWILPGIGVDQTLPENQYEVAIEQSKSNENLYRLVNPYKSGPAAPFNSSMARGYIMIDVSDADHVLIDGEGVDAGFANAELFITKLYCYNALSLYSHKDDIPAEEVVAKYGSAIPYTTYKEGVVRLSYMKKSENSSIYNDANFGDQTAPLGGYQWSDENDVTVDMSAAIYFPGSYSGVKGITEKEGADVRYYNLQGVEIANPDKGVYIRVEGSKSTKVMK